MNKPQGIDALRKKHRGGSVRIPEEADMASSWRDQAGCKEDTAFSLGFLDLMYSADGEEVAEEGDGEPGLLVRLLGSQSVGCLGEGGEPGSDLMTVG